MAVDVTDATFETEVLKRSHEIPIVVDLWAPWCGPCQTLGPIIERVVDATEGAVGLVKVNVDDNPQVSSAFKVQSIPAVFALRDGKVIDSFVGAQGEAFVQQWVARLAPSAEEVEVASLLAAGDEVSLRHALELDPDNEGVIVALAELLVTDGRGDDALELIGRIPETPSTRRVAALARQGGALGDAGIEAKLDELLTRVKHDDDARRQFVDLLELLGPDDDRTSRYRRALTAQLY
jgi:putative thioredoxin